MPISKKSDLGSEILLNSSKLTFILLGSNEDNFTLTKNCVQEKNLQTTCNKCTYLEITNTISLFELYLEYI